MISWISFNISTLIYGIPRYKKQNEAFGQFQNQRWHLNSYCGQKLTLQSNTRALEWIVSTTSFAVNGPEIPSVIRTMNESLLWLIRVNLA